MNAREAPLEGLIAKVRESWESPGIPIILGRMESDAYRNEPSLPGSRFFPNPADAGPEGFVALGGPLTPERLLDAYRHGVFPWPDSEHSPMLWWSPDPRAVIEFDNFHVARRLLRTLRQGAFHVTCNQAFPDVMRGCATGPDRKEGTWITPPMLRAYARLHRLGAAHSVEVWRNDTLVGGIYGVSVGGAFAAESMFHRVTDASKIALVHLVAHLRQCGYQLLDIQQWTEHTGRMGATEIPRVEYLHRLRNAVDLPVTFGASLHSFEGRWPKEI